MEDEIIIDKIKNRPRVGVARELARKLLKNVGIQYPPVSLWKIIVNLKMENNFDVQPVYDFGERVSGIIVKVDDNSTVGFNKKQHWNRRRFTIAHEIGHFKMKTMCNGFSSVFDNNNPSEIEANQFAAELLIPSKFLKNDFKNSVENIKALSEKYRVSKEAMGWKIAKTPGLLNRI